MSSAEVRRYCDLIHASVNKAEADINWLLGKIAAAGDSGWSSESLQMIQFVADTKILWLLADKIDHARNILIQETPSTSLHYT